jgi:hypothetical protein
MRTAAANGAAVWAAIAVCGGLCRHKARNRGTAAMAIGGIVGAILIAASTE